MEHGGPRLSALGACRDGVGSPFLDTQFGLSWDPNRVVQVVPQERAGQPNVEAIRLVHSSMLHSLVYNVSMPGLGNWGTGRMCVAAGPPAHVHTLQDSVDDSCA
jgi:hypothetical protein